MSKKGWQPGSLADLQRLEDADPTASVAQERRRARAASTLQNTSSFNALGVPNAYQLRALRLSQQQNAQLYATHVANALHTDAAGSICAEAHAVPDEGSSNGCDNNARLQALYQQLQHEHARRQQLERALDDELNHSKNQPSDHRG